MRQIACKRLELKHRYIYNNFILGVDVVSKRVHTTAAVIIIQDYNSNHVIVMCICTSSRNDIHL